MFRLSLVARSLGFDSGLRRALDQNDFTRVTALLLGRRTEPLAIPPSLLVDVQAAALTRAAELSPRQISLLLLVIGCENEAFAFKPDSKFMQSMETQTLARLNDFSSVEIADSLTGLSKMTGLWEASLAHLRALEDRSIAIVDSFQPFHLTFSLQALCALPNARPSERYLSAITRHAEATIDTFRAWELADLVRALRNLGVRPRQQLLAAVEQQALALSNGFNLIDLARLLPSLVAFRFFQPSAAFLAMAEQRMARVLKSPGSSSKSGSSSDPVYLSNSVFAHTHYAHTRPLSDAFLAALQKHVLASVDEWQASDLSKLLLAFENLQGRAGKWRGPSTEVLTAIEGRIVECVDQCDLNLVALLTKGLCVLSHAPSADFLQKMEGKFLAAPVDTVSAKDLVYFLRSFYFLKAPVQVPTLKLLDQLVPKQARKFSTGTLLCLIRLLPTFTGWQPSVALLNSVGDHAFLKLSFFSKPENLQEIKTCLGAFSYWRPSNSLLKEIDTRLSPRAKIFDKLEEKHKVGLRLQESERRAVHKKDDEKEKKQRK